MGLTFFPRFLRGVHETPNRAARASSSNWMAAIPFLKRGGVRLERKRVTYFLGVFKDRGKRKSKRPTYIKIGMASAGRDNIERRINQLRTGSVYRLELIFTLEGKCWERKYHRKFSRLRVRGEFYKATPALMKQLADMQEIRRLVSLVEDPTGSGQSLFKTKSICCAVGEESCQRKRREHYRHGCRS